MCCAASRMFHGKLDGETAHVHNQGMPKTAGLELTGCSPFESGLLFGLLVGEGHFGGDGRQAQVTLRMHSRHEKLFRWLERVVPEARLYGPYHHGGRDYFQWMVRGAYLRETLVPFLAGRREWMDDYVRGRFETMCERYGLLQADAHVLSSGSSSTGRP